MARPDSKITPSRVRPTGRSIIAFVIFLLLAIFALAGCIRDEDLTLEQRQHQLEKDLMCPVCDGQTLDQSQAQIARDMKAVIVEKLRAGETNAQIRDYFVARYGEEVLASPTASGLNLLAWFMPAAILLAGGAIVFFALRGMRRPAGAPRTGQSDRGLEPYLAQVDRDLGIDATSSAEGNTGGASRG